MMKRSTIAILLACASVHAGAQTSAPEAPKSEERAATEATAPPTEGTLASLAWLEGCWRGSVNKREFREHWLPLRGDLMLGMSHTVIEGKTQDYAFLRIEPRADGVWYVALTPGQPEAAFKMSGVTIDKESGDTTIAFDRPRSGFPQHISYRRGTEGWLYAQVDGDVDGAPRKVIYPMRRIDCQSGELITK
jgi:hypothetical protein